ncbi:MAG TPA: heavy metal translocating P-type ATPase, partial [Gammaproteobacteria bacterium]|nr:heavy metal translocating P-type ATPase [Gammaproteobacteria bacterium]
MSRHHKEGCYHCGLPVPDQQPVNRLIQGEQRQFCCHGCGSVCQAIYGAGMEGFYERTPEGIQLAPPPELSEEAALFDLEEIQSEYVRSSGGL